MAENLLASLTNPSPEDIQKALMITGGNPGLAGAPPPLAPAVAAPVNGPAVAPGFPVPPPSPGVAADAALAAAFASPLPSPGAQPGGGLDAPAPQAAPLDISQQARLDAPQPPPSPATAAPSPVPAPGAAPSPGGDAGAAGVDGAALFRRELANIRATGLDDKTIRAGVEKGLLPDSLKTALENEESAVRSLADAQRDSTIDQADLLKTQTDAAAIERTASQNDRDLIERDVAGHIQTLSELREERQALKITDPWANASTGQKILAAIAMMIGGIGAGLTGGPNLAVQVINTAIERDLKVQMARRRAKGEEIKTQRNIVQLARGRLGDFDRGVAAARLDMWDAVERKLKVLTLRQQGAETEGNAQMLLAQIGQKKAELEQEFAATARKTATAEYWEKRKQATAQALSKAAGDTQGVAEVLEASGIPENVVRALEIRAAKGKAGKSDVKLAKLNAALDAGTITKEQHAAAVAKETSVSLDAVAGRILTLVDLEGRAPNDKELRILAATERLNPAGRIMAGLGAGGIASIWTAKHGSKTPTFTAAELAEVNSSTKSALERRGKQGRQTAQPPLVTDKAGFDDLNTGDRFQTADGKMRVKP